MTQKIIAIFNQSGGVGKTTLTFNLAYHLQALGHPTLVIDLDSQATLTDFLGLLNTTDSPYAALVEEGELPIHKHEHGFDCVPATNQLAKAEFLLTSLEFSESRLGEAISKLETPYTFILIDCPPSIGNLTVNALVAATHILAPISTKYKGYAGTDELLGTLARIKKRGNKNLQIAGFVPTLYQSSTKHDRDILEQIRSQCSQLSTVFDPLPLATAMDNASMSKQPLAVYDRRHKNIPVLDAIAQELVKL